MLHMQNICAGFIYKKAISLLEVIKMENKPKLICNKIVHITLSSLKEREQSHFLNYPKIRGWLN